ncbi:MAG: hypothetical protein ABIB79_00910 [archaeon]
MGFFDFLKGKESKLKTDTQKVSLSELAHLIKGRKKEIEFKEAKILDSIKDSIEEFVRDINEKVEVLEGIDVEAKKAEDRFKAIVRKNLDNYIRYAKETVERVDKLEKKRPDQTINDIDKIFMNFNKNSHVTYHKATILIGKEMAVVKKRIKEFSDYLLEIHKENKGILNLSKTISSIEILLRELGEVDGGLDRIDQIIELNESKIRKNKNSMSNIKYKIDEIKASERYLEFMKKEQETKEKRNELERKIFELKGLIDFKALGNFFHINKKEMDRIKDYRENFYNKFLEDNGEEIIRFIDEAKLNNEKIREKVNEIIEKKKEIDDIQIEGDETDQLEDEIMKLESENDNLKIEKVKAQKKREKVEEKRREIFDKIKKEVGEIGVELDDD